MKLSYYLHLEQSVHAILELYSQPCANNMAACQQRSRRVELRERSERGFVMFLQNLKSVLKILANVGEQELGTDILIETSQIESRDNADFYDALEISYSAPLNLASPGRGRKSYKITKDQVEHLRSLYFSWEAIAGIIQLEDEGNLDVLNDLHIFSLHHVYIPKIESSLEELVRQMNNWPLSTERNLSPLQMWEKGMLENLHSGHIALSEAEIDHFGVDPNSVQTVEGEDYQVDISPPLFSLSDEQLAQLPDPLSDDENGGKDLFLQCIDIINMFLTSSEVS
ncbi:hypothetical protein AWC38_SpisGene5755 [Stylophora pistillata]|uniref:Integrase core domain-containing protein n=1 Tax=Stylophora pistillata TaxID=50429 RepID=A0A2B4SK45_STYPI|nr:hypothetical protein AWC38_SpisGene5755 [Stylophora pistillata]